MATFVKYHCFPEDLGKGVHDFENDTLKIALTNTAPDASADALLEDINELSAGGGYTSGGGAVGNVTWSQSGGVAKLVGDDVVFTASGSMGPARYAVLYNASAADGPLIAYWDRGVEVSLIAGDVLTVDLNQDDGILTIG